MQVRKIDTERRSDVRRFVRFSFELYRDCSQWVPPFISDMQAMLDRRKNPYYARSDADFFLVEENGRTLGRLAVMDKPRYNDYQQTKTGMFGYFEAIDDRRVSRLLFEAAFDWVRARGLNQIIGPQQLVGVMGGGILVEGFEHRPAMGIPYNYGYYDALLQDVGFEKDNDSLSGYFSGDQDIPERYLRVAEKVKARRGFQIKTFESMKEVHQWVDPVIRTHITAFASRENFYPPSEEEMQDFAKTLLAIIDYRTAKLVLKDDQVVGYALAYPDFSVGLQRARGRLFPLGWWHILRDRKRTEWANGNGIGVLPEYQGIGASILLYTETAKTVKDFGFKHVDVVQIGEENFPSRSAMETLGVTWYKRHRNYRRDL